MLRRERRWSVLPAMTIDGYLEDPLVVQGSVTIEAFEEWFEYKVLPQLHAGQIVVMDNASIHRSDLVKQLCLTHGIQLEYLPPYSPDLNPIEESFNALKLWVKHNIRMAYVFRDFGAFMEHALRELTDEIDPVGWFVDCGYE
jgi:transposase InsO family protein